MNVGNICSDALNRAGLSVSDLGMRNMAKNMLDEIIQSIWESKHWYFRKIALTFATAIAGESVSLDKRVRVQNIVPNTVRGTDPIRRLRYEPSFEFYKLRPFALPQTAPYYYRDGQFQGFSNNPSAASVITFSSSLTNYTTGTCAVINGMTRVVMTTGSISVDKLGQYIRFGTDNKAYQIVSLDFGSTSIFYLSDPYQGTTNAVATHTIGDIFQKATVLGYVSGELQEEEIQLNGSTSVLTVKQFTSLVKISKSGKTGGYITATSNSAAVVNAILDPGETEVDIQTVKLYPIPAAVETINYEAYIIHPHLYKESDSPLIPGEYHNLLVLELFIRLQTEWNEKEVSPEVFRRRSEIMQQMIDTDNNTDQWIIQNDMTEESERSRFNNLPAGYDNDNFF